MQLIDIGVNLAHASFDEDRQHVITRAREAGVTLQILTGVHLQGSEAAAALAQTQPDLYATAGVHPHYARDFDGTTLQRLEALSQHPRVVALGECGLDFNRNYSEPQDQERCFEAQLGLACRLGLPLFLHQRDAHTRFLEMIRSCRDQISRAVVHCFTGDAEELRQCLDLDLHIGITGWICDERRGLHLREILHKIPPERLMIETDAPFLIPRTMSPMPKNRRNEPANLSYVLNSVAAALGRNPAKVAAETRATALAFFGIQVPADLDQTET